jgi:hypothetical protein
MGSAFRLNRNRASPWQGFGALFHFRGLGLCGLGRGQEVRVKFREQQAAPPLSDGAQLRDHALFFPRIKRDARYAQLGANLVQGEHLVANGRNRCAGREWISHFQFSLCEIVDYLLTFSNVSEFVHFGKLALIGVRYDNHVIIQWVIFGLFH